MRPPGGPEPSLWAAPDVCVLDMPASGKSRPHLSPGPHTVGPQTSRKGPGSRVGVPVPWQVGGAVHGALLPLPASRCGTQGLHSLLWGGSYRADVMLVPSRTGGVTQGQAYLGSGQPEPEPSLGPSHRPLVSMRGAGGKAASAPELRNLPPAVRVQALGLCFEKAVRSEVLGGQRGDGQWLPNGCAASLWGDTSV